MWFTRAEFCDIIRYCKKGEWAVLAAEPSGPMLRRSREVSMKQLNLQDVFLNQARREKLTVTIYLTNGFQFKGIVRGFDSYTVILDCEGRQNLVYKHAISTISPYKVISIQETAEDDQDEE